MPGPTVLVTGMSGLIGGAVRKHLAGRYELRALNRRAVEGVPCHQADVADLDAIQPAFDGVHAVVHLAASVGTRARRSTRSSAPTSSAHTTSSKRRAAPGFGAWCTRRAAQR